MHCAPPAEIRAASLLHGHSFAYIEDQNVLIGLAAFLMALWATITLDRREAGTKKVLHGPGPKARPWRLLQVESSLACNLNPIDAKVGGLQSLPLKTSGIKRRKG
jgi:hypothetical protein